MMTVYIDSDCRCHVSDDGTMTAVQTRFFDGMCREFIEGYRFIPAGESWTREDGVVFHGEMLAPWKDYAGLDAEKLPEAMALLAEVFAET